MMINEWISKFPVYRMQLKIQSVTHETHQDPQTIAAADIK